MTVSTYRLTTLGKLGAAMFVLPTPAAGFYAMPRAVDSATAAYERALRQVGGHVAAAAPSQTILIILATATLIGFVLLLIGREIVTEG